MAHYEKFGRGSLGHLFLHMQRAFKTKENGEREYINFGNRDIDTKRTPLNYNLCRNENGKPINQRKRYAY